MQVELTPGFSTICSDALHIMLKLNDFGHGKRITATLDSISEYLRTQGAPVAITATKYTPYAIC